jgi:hypothetical protein
MKKLLSIILIISALFSLTSCFYRYPAIESTEEEKRTVMYIETDIENYYVPYELYRAVFLRLKSQIDGGNDAVWSDPQKSIEYKEIAHAAVTKKIAEIYTAFYVAEKHGIIDPYSDAVERKIDEYIKIGVEGGVMDKESINGFGGDYDKYLASLKEIGLNYNAHVLMYRYRIVMSEIYKHYLGESDEILNQNHVGSNLEFTKDDVKAFYNSDECVRLIPAYIEAKYSNSLSRAENIRQGIITKSQAGEVAVRNYINSQLLTDPYGMECGLIIGKHSLERDIYDVLTEKAFLLGVGDVSDIITVTADEVGYYVLYRAEKSENNFNTYYDDILTVYLNNCVGQIIDTAYLTALDSVKDTDYIKGLDFANIKMN